MESAAAQAKQTIMERQYFADALKSYGLDASDPNFLKACDALKELCKTVSIPPQESKRVVEALKRYGDPNQFTVLAARKDKYEGAIKEDEELIRKATNENKTKGGILGWYNNHQMKNAEQRIGENNEELGRIANIKPVLERFNGMLGGEKDAAYQEGAQFIAKGLMYRGSATLE